MEIYFLDFFLAGAFFFAAGFFALAMHFTSFPGGVKPSAIELAGEKMFFAHRLTGDPVNLNGVTCT